MIRICMAGLTNAAKFTWACISCLPHCICINASHWNEKFSMTGCLENRLKTTLQSWFESVDQLMYVKPHCLVSMKEVVKSRVVRPICSSVLISVAPRLVPGQVSWIFEIRLLLSYFFCLISFGSKQENVCSSLALHQWSRRCGFGLEPNLCSFWGC